MLSASSPSLAITGLGTTLFDTSPRPIASPAAQRTASMRSISARSASSSAGSSRPVRPRSRRTHDHQRHRGVDAGHLESVDDVDALAGGKHRAGDRAPGVEEVQADRRRGAGHAVDAGLAVVGDAPARRQHGHVDARARVDVEHAHRRLAVLRAHQPLLDRERRDAREHVAAVGPRVDRLLPDADLREQVVDVAARLRRLRDDRDLAGQRAAAADAVDLQQVGRADRADQRLVARRLVLRQPFAQEERSARGAGTHQDAGDDSVHGCNLRRRHCKSELHL